LGAGARTPLVGLASRAPSAFTKVSTNLLEWTAFFRAQLTDTHLSIAVVGNRHFDRQKPHIPTCHSANNSQKSALAPQLALSRRPIPMTFALVVFATLLALADGLTALVINKVSEG
jgi:hypothetical protein